LSALVSSLELLLDIVEIEPEVFQGLPMVTQILRHF
jgi:hypothetical protein